MAAGKFREPGTGGLLRLLLEERGLIALFASYLAGCALLLIFLRGAAFDAAHDAARARMQPAVAQLLYERSHHRAAESGVTRDGVRMHVLRDAAEPEEDDFVRHARALEREARDSHTTRVAELESFEPVRAAPRLRYARLTADRVVLLFETPVDDDLRIAAERFGVIYALCAALGLFVIGGFALAAYRLWQRDSRRPDPSGDSRSSLDLAARARPESPPPFPALPVIVLLSTFIFAIDLAAPLGSGIGAAYLVVVIVSLWSQDRAHTFIAAALATLLVIARLPFALPLDGVWVVLASRTLSIFSIWTVAIVGLWQQRTLVAQSVARAQAAAARITEQKLARASRASAEGHWEFDAARDMIWTSASFGELLGLPRGEAEFTRDEFWRHAHPDDRAVASAAHRAHLERGEPYDVELRLRAPDGSWRWFRARGAAEFDAGGKMLRFGGSMIDIHREKLAEQDLRELRVRYQRALTGMQDGLWDWDMARARVWLSPRFCELLGLPSQSLEGTIVEGATFRAFVHEEDLPKLRAATTAHLERDEPYDVEVRMRCSGGDYRWFRARALAARDAVGKPVSLSGSLLDVSAQRAAQEALVAATEAAAAANRAKSAFLANMSHEIRTPMNGILGMTDLLLDTTLSPVQLEYARTVRASAESLLAIINDILDLSKIEANKLVVERTPMDLRECVESVGAIMAVQAVERRLELVVHVDPRVPAAVLADPHRLRQVLVNLVGNAIKFTKRGEVVLRVWSETDAAGRALLRGSVRDTGVGMDADTVAKLFTPFTQADASTTRRFGGTGLGLSIVRRLLDLMGGSIEVASEPGRGSTFTFTLPCEAVDAPGAPLPTAPHRSRIVVASGNATLRHCLCEDLVYAGWDAVSAGSGAEAIAVIASRATDSTRATVLVCDNALPDMSSAELAAHVRTDGAAAAPAVVVLTTLDRAVASQRLHAAGIAATVTKPVRTRLLIEALRRIESGEDEPATRDRETVATAVVTTAGAPVATAAAAPSSAAIRGARVLVVEDNEVNQQVARRFLERLGCAATIAEDGSVGVELACSQTFDLVLMDVQMPVMDGIAATREIRRREGDGRQVPIVALTASVMHDELDRCREAGVNDLLPKPLDPAKLSALLARYVAVEAIDLHRLREFVSGDPEFARELADTFIGSARSILAELARERSTGDRPAIARLAHKLKGSSLSVCANRLAAAADALERGAAALSEAELDAALAAVTREYGPAVTELGSDALLARIA